MRLSLLAIGKLKKKYYKQGCEDYQSRLQHYTRFECEELRPEPAKPGRIAEEIKAKEAERILHRCSNTSLLIALDEHGEQWSTLDLAKFIEKQQLHGQRELILCIGGSLGLHQSVLKRSNRTLALSKLTLPHEMARLLLLEQLYRAHTVIAGEPYHNP